MENPLIFIVGIVLIVVIVIWRLNDLLFFSMRAKKTEGVISNWMQSKVKGKLILHPVISFTTENGETLKYRADESCEGKPMYPVGTKVTVLYNPKDPKQVKTRYPKV